MTHRNHHLQPAMTQMLPVKVGQLAQTPKMPTNSRHLVYNLNQ